MGCDHLDVRTFKKSMERIQRTHAGMHLTYKTNLMQAFDDMKRAWDTPKGWTKLHELSTKIHMRMSSLNKTIEHNYTVMDESGTDWARSQQVMLFFVPPIPSIGYERYEIGNHDGEINEVNKEEVLAAAKKIKFTLDSISEIMLDIDYATKTDEGFGYYSTGEVNPREEINKRVKAESSLIDEDFAKYADKMNEEIEEDIRLRNEALSKGIDDLAQ